MSALNWGEVGVVNVIRVDEESTRVVVNKARRTMVHITGRSERQLADRLFASIAEYLGRTRAGA
jgi:hypothetical protein